MAQEFVPGASNFHSPTQYAASPLAHVLAAAAFPSPEPGHSELSEPGFPFFETERPFYRDEWTAADHAAEHRKQQHAEAQQSQAESASTTSKSPAQPKPDIPNLIAHLEEEKKGHRLMTFSYMSFFPRGKPYVSITTDGQPAIHIRQGTTTTESEEDGTSSISSLDSQAAALVERLTNPGDQEAVSGEPDQLTARYLSADLLTSMEHHADQALFDVILPPSVPGPPSPRTDSHPPGVIGQGRPTGGTQQPNGRRATLQPLGWRPPAIRARPPAQAPARPKRRASGLKNVRFADEVDLPLEHLRNMSRSGSSASRDSVGAGEKQEQQQQKEEEEEEEQGDVAAPGTKLKWAWVRGADGRMGAKRCNRAEAEEIEKEGLGRPRGGRALPSAWRYRR